MLMANSTSYSQALVGRQFLLHARPAVRTIRCKYWLGEVVLQFVAGNRSGSSGFRLALPAERRLRHGRYDPSWRFVIQPSCNFEMEATTKATRQKGSSYHNSHHLWYYVFSPHSKCFTQKSTLEEISGLASSPGYAERKHNKFRVFPVYRTDIGGSCLRLHASRVKGSELLHKSCFYCTIHSTTFDTRTFERSNEHLPDGHLTRRRCKSLVLLVSFLQ